MKTFWMSFCDAKQPVGRRFLGACVIDVDEADVTRIQSSLEKAFPHHAKGAEWIAAATKKSWEQGCNPGGELATCDMTLAAADVLARYPRNRLLSRDEVDRLDAEITAARAPLKPPQPTTSGAADLDSLRVREIQREIRAAEEYLRVAMLSYHTSEPCDKAWPCATCVKRDWLASLRAELERYTVKADLRALSRVAR